MDEDFSLYNLICRLSQIVDEGGSEMTVIERPIKAVHIPPGDMLVITWRIFPPADPECSWRIEGG